MTAPIRRKCRVCDVELLLVKDSTGKTQPLDLKAPVFLVQSDMTGEQVAVRTDAYVSHFSSCSDPNRFSKSKMIPGGIL